VLNLLLQCPDSHVFWVPFAILRGALVLLTRQVDVICSSSPPHSSHLASAALAKCFGKPYVLDFRDPWEFSSAFARLMRWLKQLVVSRAARVIVVSDAEREEFLQEFPRLEPRRVVAIPNGYDPDDFASLEAVARDPSKIYISHVGTIHRGAGGEFFAALRLLVRDVPAVCEWLRVDLLGVFPEEYGDAVRSLERTGILSVSGFLPHSAALARVVTSDVLVILLGGDAFAPSELPAKLSEYLYARKPILAVAKEGALWDVLARSGAGIAVRPHDPPALAAAILRLCSELRKDALELRIDSAYVERFDRRALVAKLGVVLDEVARGEKGDAGECSRNAQWI
jgi:glycosyltransferase involved in cell wall biosynthesis